MKILSLSSQENIVSMTKYCHRYINYIDRKDMLSAIVPNLRKQPVSCLDDISNSECKQTSAILTVHMS